MRLDSADVYILHLISSAEANLILGTRQEEAVVAEGYHRKLSGRVVVVTGASSGFGRGAALRFARSGARVALAARRDEVLDEVAEQVREFGGQPLVAPTDVGNRDDVEALCRATVEQFGGIDVWVNNAGAGALGRFEDVPLEDHLKVIETDLLGTLYGSYFAMQRFREQKFGTLINVASVIGKVPAPYFASYCSGEAWRSGTECRDTAGVARKRSAGHPCVYGDAHLHGHALLRARGELFGPGDSSDSGGLRGGARGGRDRASCDRTQG